MAKRPNKKWAADLPPSMGFEDEEWHKPDLIRQYYTCKHNRRRVYVWGNNDLWHVQLALGARFELCDSTPIEVQPPDPFLLKLAIIDLTMKGK